MDIFDYLAHRRLEREIDRNTADNLRTDNEIIVLTSKVRSLEFANRAIWSLMKQMHGLTDQDLERAADALDEADAMGPDVCPSCGRKQLVLNAVNCTWCGLPLHQGPFEEMAEAE